MLSVFTAAADSPHAEALLCEGQRLSFSALAERCLARSAELLALGISSHDASPVALIVDNSLAMFEYLYLLLAWGVPVLPVHPRLTTPERQQLLTLASAQVLIDPQDSAPAVPRSTRSERLVGAIPDARALTLVASSGSSGIPKLIELSRGAFLALARADAERVPGAASDRALLCLPLSHVGGLSVVIRALVARRCCVVFRPSSRAGLLASAPELAACLVSERVTLLSLVPPVLRRLLQVNSELLRRAPLRALLLGGQACPLDLFTEARQQGIPVLTSYGLTEACSQVSTLGFPPPQEPPVQGGVVGVGFPLSGVELRVVGGVLHVRGPTLLTRYVAGPEPRDADGFFHTGDRGEFDPDLGLFVFGRTSELIISGGENVDPSEVEHALLATGGLEAACVFGVPDPEFGELVVAVLEPSPGSQFVLDVTLAGLDQRLARFKHPRRICCFEQLPRLASGKLDRAQIRRDAPSRLEPIERLARD